MRNRLRSIIRPLCRMICLITIILSYSCNVIAKEQKQQVVRVGFFAFDGYHMQNEDGSRSGYGYEILQHMAGYTDWEYEYIGYDKSWSEMQDMLERGEIDLLTSAQMTPERKERFEFSENSIGTSSAILTVKAGDTKYMLRDYSNWSGMRVGMIEGNSRNDDLAEFAKENGFTYEPVYFDNTDAMVNALKQGDDIDAAITSNLRSIDGEWILVQFAASPFYIVVQKGNEELLTEINYAIDAMDATEPGLRTKLFNQYYHPDHGDEIPYTLEEREFIEAMKDTTFTAVINPDRAPFSYLEKEQLSGIIYDISTEIIQRSKLNIQFVVAKDRTEYWELAEAGAVDIRFDAGYDFSQAEEMGYRLTLPYLDTSISKLYRVDQGDASSVAILKESDIARNYDLLDASGDVEVVYYDTTAAVINAVLSGKQSAAYLYRRSADLAVQNDITNRLAVEDLYGYDNSFAIAVNAKQDHLLYSVMNRAVASIGDNEIEEIVKRYTSYDGKEITVIGFIYSHPIAMLGIVTGLCLVLVLLISFISNANKRKEQDIQLTEEKRRSELLTDALASAEDAGAAKSRFLSRVSHEMRTPLNAIIGLMDLAKDADEQQVRSYLGNVDTAAKQIRAAV